MACSLFSLCSCSSSCIGATSIFHVLSKYANLSQRFCADFLRSSWPFSFEHYKVDFMIPIRLAKSRLREHRMREGRSRGDRKRATKSGDKRRKPRVDFSVCGRLNLICIMLARKIGSRRKFESLVAVDWLDGSKHQDEWRLPELKQNCFPVHSSSKIEKSYLYLVGTTFDFGFFTEGFLRTTLSRKLAWS